ncbi:MAG: LysM peptidoglycan-binding domain-containing protein [Bacilli bacterium]
MDKEYSLRNIKGIVVDAGHGGDDPGAVANGLKEKDFNLEAANYMYKRFKELGIPVVITRDTDTTLTREERVNLMKNSFGSTDDVLVISNHINAGGGEGAEVVYALRNNDTLAKSILKAIGQEGQIMRKYYQRRLPTDPSQDYYYIMRDTKSTSPLLIEYGFIDNPKDVRKLQTNLINYVEAVVKSVAEYAGVAYKPPVNSNKKYYTVINGDSLYKIAKKYGVTVDALKEINNLTSDILQTGQLLVIPGSTPPSTSGLLSYIVTLGDTLYKLAKQYETTVDDLININNLSTTALTIGQILKVPTKEEVELPISKYYIIEKDDSLYSIAKKFNTTVSELLRINKLTSSNLTVGQKLLIPEVSIIPPPDLPPIIETIKYIVKKGDSLWNIAKKFNTTVDDIKKNSNLNSENLTIGQILTIPKPKTNPSWIEYIVVSGDSLWSIAKKFNITVESLKESNNISTSTLNIGQVLKIFK